MTVDDHKMSMDDLKIIVRIEKTYADDSLSDKEKKNIR